MSCVSHSVSCVSGCAHGRVCACRGVRGRCPRVSVAFFAVAGHALCVIRMTCVLMLQAHFDVNGVRSWSSSVCACGGGCLKARPGCGRTNLIAARTHLQPTTPTLALPRSTYAPTTNRQPSWLLRAGYTGYGRFGAHFGRACVSSSVEPRSGALDASTGVARLVLGCAEHVDVLASVQCGTWQRESRACAGRSDGGVRSAPRLWAQPTR